MLKTQLNEVKNDEPAYTCISFLKRRALNLESRCHGEGEEATRRLVITGWQPRQISETPNAYCKCETSPSNLIVQVKIEEILQSPRFAIVELIYSLVVLQFSKAWRQQREANSGALSSAAVRWALKLAEKIP